MTSPSFLAVSPNVQASSGAFTVAKPTGVAAGDLLLLVMQGLDGTATVSPPDGTWTLLDGYSPGNGFSAQLQVYWKVAGASEPSSYAASFSTTSEQGGAYIAAYRGGDTTTPIRGHVTTHASSASTSVVSPSVGGAVAGDTLVCIYSDAASQHAATYTPAAGMTQRNYYKPANTGYPMAMDDAAIATSGATGTQTATASLTVTPITMSVVLAQASSGGTNGTASGATLTGTSSLSPGGATGNGSATTSGATLTGTASITPGAASGTSPGGTLTTKPFQNNTTTVLANQTGVTLNIWNANTGALVLQKTGLSTDANGVITVQDPAIVTGTTYAYEPVFSTGARRLPTKAAT